MTHRERVLKNLASELKKAAATITPNFYQLSPFVVQALFEVAYDSAWQASAREQMERDAKIAECGFADHRGWREQDCEECETARVIRESFEREAGKP